MRTLILVLACILRGIVHVRAATATVSCATQVAAAIRTVDTKTDGSSVACCADRSAHCAISSQGVCASSDAAAWCIVASGQSACTITYTNATGAPCGTTSASASTTVSPYGVTALGPAYPVPLPSAATTVALTNWRWLASRSEAALCFSTDGSASTTQIATLQTRTCPADQYMLVCHGAATRGLCTAYSNDATPHELGQYYEVSLEGTPTTSPTAQPEGTTSSRPQQTVLVGSGVPRWTLAVVAVVCIVGTALLCTLAFLGVQMRRRNAPVSVPATTPFVETPVLNPPSMHPTRVELPRKRPMTQTAEAGLPPYSEPTTRSTVVTV